MENLNIEATERSPKIAFDYENHVLEISGEAYPENNDDFYRPIFNSLQEYIKEGSDAPLNFSFQTDLLQQFQCACDHETV